MTLDSKNVRVAVSGAVYIGETTEDAPTGATTAVGAGFKDLGYVSEDGVTESRERSTNEIRAWQKASLLREVVTESSMSYSFTLLETKKETVEVFYGATVGADGKVDIDPSQTGGRKSYVIDVEDGDSDVRIYLGEAEVSEVGEQVYQSGEAIGFEITLRAYPDANGVAAQKWYSDLETP